MSTRVRGPLIVIAGAALVLLTVVLLLSLRPPEEAFGPRPPGRRDGAAPWRWPVPPAAGRPAAGAPDAGSPAVTATDGGGAGAPRADVPHPVIHVRAPAAVPPEIAREPDPQRRAELLAAHRLSTARVRVSLLRRREQLLGSALAQAKKDGSWSSEKLEQAERDRRELRAAITAAEQELVELQRRSNSTR